jgi:hypothetical protein
LSSSSSSSIIVIDFRRNRLFGVLDLFVSVGIKLRLIVAVELFAINLIQSALRAQSRFLHAHVQGCCEKNVFFFFFFRAALRAEEGGRAQGQPTQCCKNNKDKHSPSRRARPASIPAAVSNTVAAGASVSTVVGGGVVVVVAAIQGACIDPLSHCVEVDRCRGVQMRRQRRSGRRMRRR